MNRRMNMILTLRDSKPLHAEVVQVIMYICQLPSLSNRLDDNGKTAFNLLNTVFELGTVSRELSLQCHLPLEYDSTHRTTAVYHRIHLCAFIVLPYVVFLHILWHSNKAVLDSSLNSECFSFDDVSFYCIYVIA